MCRTIVGTPRGVGYGQHLGRGYSYYSREMKVGVKDGKRGRCLRKTVESISYWDDVNLNPYKNANPNREGFVGRDLMLKLFIKIFLDPSLKESRWELL